MKKLVNLFSLTVCCLLAFGVILSSGASSSPLPNHHSKTKVEQAQGVFQNLLELPVSNSIEFEGKHLGSFAIHKSQGQFSYLNKIKTGLETYTSKPLFNVLITYFYFFYTW